VAILQVEDEALIQEIMADSLRDAGFDVIQAATGDEAIALVERQHSPLEALITDFHMPGTADGADVAAAVCAHYPDLPVIIASGRPDLCMRSWEWDCGYRFLGKPYLPSQLVAMLRALMEQAGPALAADGTTGRR
jgi:DNA-binding response OmpR family regulator